MDAREPGVDEVHLWWASCGAATHADPRLYGLLDATERARANRFRVGSARRRYLAARALTRLVLGRHTGVAPAALAFASGSRGKPRIENPLSGPRVCFNVAHSGDTVVVAVAGRELGVDVETVREVPSLERLAARYCSAAERDRLNRLPKNRRAAAFLKVWTGKEAYLKAIGSGVAMPLRSVEVELEPLRLARLNNDPHAAAEWTLLGADLPGPAVCTVAIRVSHPRLHVQEFSWPV
jgi:4'-phosphopantetheinyl transferase